MAVTRRTAGLSLLFGGSLVATGGVHLLIARRYFPDDVFESSLLLLVGWVTFALAFYAAGRLFADTNEFLRMRTADVGIGFFLVSVVLALLFESLGFGPEAVPEAYVLPGIGVYVGLALVGWSIGQRTEVINRLAAGG